MKPTKTQLPMSFIKKYFKKSIKELKELKSYEKVLKKNILFYRSELEKRRR